MLPAKNGRLWSFSFLWLPFWNTANWGLYSSTLATPREELTHWKRLWCWEGLGAGGKGDDRGWGGWMASPTWWTWVWVNSGRWWWTGRPGVLRFMGWQRVGHDWAIELNWTPTRIRGRVQILATELFIRQGEFSLTATNTFVVLKLHTHK